MKLQELLKLPFHWYLFDEIVSSTKLLSERKMLIITMNDNTKEQKFVPLYYSMSFD